MARHTYKITYNKNNSQESEKYGGYQNGRKRGGMVMCTKNC